MSVSGLKEKQKKSTKLHQACNRCGKAQGESWGSTITRWVFQLQACECESNQLADPSAVASLVPVTPECTKQPGGKESQSEPVNETSVNLGDRYEILETIGQGGMGIVYRVKDKTLQKEFAVKVLRDDFATDPSAIKRFEQEADAVSGLTHPNMLAVYGHGSTTSGEHYIVMDLLEGESLSQLLKRETKLEASRVIGISTQICDALAHAHMKGLIHRDLKPSNVMLTNKDHGPDTVKVLDFGIAKLMPTSNRETQNLTETGDLFGSPSYMSPEQCLGFNVDARSDIYSLGCMMYEMLTGQPPFAGKNPIQTVVKHLNEEPPPLQKVLPTSRTHAGLHSIILRCLEKDAGQRYQSMDQVKVDLQLAAEGKLPKQSKKTARKPIPLSVPVVLTIILLAVSWLNLQTLSFSGLGGTTPYSVSTVLAVGLYLTVALCAVAWAMALVYWCRNQLKKMRGSSWAPHERWKTSTLVMLLLGFLPVIGLILLSGVQWALSILFQNYPIILPFEVACFAALMANMSFAIAFVSSLGWALTRLASAFNSSLAMQKRLSFLLITSVCGLVILDRPLIAWLPFASSYAFVDLFGNGPGSGSSNPGLELALWINPNFAEAYNRRGWMKRYAGVPGAVNDFSKVISLHPNRSMEESALRIRAEYYANAGKLDDAIDDLERAIQLGQRDSSLDYGDLADYYARAKLYEKALAAYDEVIRKDSQNAEMYDRRAQIYEQLGREEQALKDYSLASALRPTDPTYYHKVVALYKKLAKSKKALEDFKRMLKENSGLGHLF